MDSTWHGYSGLSWPSGGNNFIVSLMRTYIQAGLRHRLTFTPYPIGWGTWNGSDYSSVNATSFNQTLTGFVDATAATTEYGNSSLTSFTQGFSGVYQSHVVNAGLCSQGVTTPPADLITETTKRAQILAGLLSPSMRSKVLVLPIDEAGGGEVGCGATNPTLDYNSFKAMSAAIRAAGLKVSATNSRKDQLLNTANTPPTNDYIDTWIAPLYNVVGRDWNGVFFDKTGDYATDIANGASLWWYQSCMTKGCYTQGGASYNGNVQYMVEYPAMRVRIYPWLSFKYGIGGDLYYSVTGQYANDPWNSLWAYGGNGDGTLFYPGVANLAADSLPSATRGQHTPAIGGAHDIPIESIRLKMLREGMEDYEYLNMLKNLGAGAWAQSEVNTIATNTYTYDQNENDMYAVREALANKIMELNNSPLPPPDTTPPAAPTGVSVN